MGQKILPGDAATRRYNHEKLVAECRDLPCLKQLLACRVGRSFWVFGYGSLMWNPGFPHQDLRPALLHGYHRRFCVWSHNYRGTPECPGLVLGLDRGGSCWGIAFKVDSCESEAVLDYLHEREMTTRVYHPRLVDLHTAQGPVLGLAFVVDRRHQQYTGHLTLHAMAELIAQARGKRGPCADYLCNTVQRMEQLSIDPGHLKPLLRLVRQHRTDSGLAG
ncbi:MAG: gamma-glutamylcyclotransferase [Rhodospirillales bacterium]|nr:gamma-glutamylcyclotransferase [Rhodospirillales bacterium]